MRNKNGKTVFYEKNGETVSYRLNVLLDKTFRRKKSVVPFLLCLVLPVFAQDEVEKPISRKETKDQLDQASLSYQEGEYGAAADIFSMLRDEAPEGELDPDALRLAEGLSWLKSGDADKAMDALESVEGFDVDSLRSQKRLTQGNAAYQLAQQALEAQDLETAKEKSETAQNLYRSALQVNPRNQDAAHNLELTQRFIQELPEPPPQENQDQEDSENQENSEKQQDQEQQNSQDQENQDQENQDSQDQQNQDQEDQQQESEDPQNDQEEEQDSQDEQDQSQGSEGEQEQESEPSEGTEPTEQPLPEDYSEEQAQTILDTYDEQERRQRRQFLQQRVRTIPVEKDW